MPSKLNHLLIPISPRLAKIWWNADRLEKRLGIKEVERRKLKKQKHKRIKKRIKKHKIRKQREVKILSTPNKHKDIRLTHAYRKWRQSVMKQADYKCEVCQDPAVDVHHIIPICVRPTDMLNINNGQALCLKCHRKKHPDLPDCFFRKRRFIVKNADTYKGLIINKVV